MPLPKPNKGEKQGDFVGRCIGFVRGEDKGVSQEQAAAMCYRAWRDRGKEDQSMDGMNLTEQFDGVFEGVSVDESQHVIRNVVLLGAVSKNGRRYHPEAMRKAAQAGLYEDRKCFLNHGGMFDQSRAVQDILGKFKGTRYDEATCKVRGDLHLLDGDAAAQKVMRIAKTMPDLAGLSHVAEGKMRKVGTAEKPVDEVYQITRVASVDVVAEPATTSSMYESTEGPEGQDNSERTRQMEWDKLTLAELKKNRNDIYEEAVAAGASSRDDEIKGLKEENATLQKTVDDQKVIEATRHKEAVVDKALADLPEHARTDVFRKLCLNAHTGEGGFDQAVFEASVAELVKDRKALVGDSTVRNMGSTQDRTTRESTEKKAEAVDEALAL